MVESVAWRRQLCQQRAAVGPRISVLQGDFVLSPVNDPSAPSDDDKRRSYFALFDQATAHSPDMVVLPETPWFMYLQQGGRYSAWNYKFVRLAAQHHTNIVVGSLAEQPQPPGTYPAVHRYNSAFVYRPDVREPDRYDKIHLVPFGEYVPFRYCKRLHWLYRFLNDGPWNPWGRDGFEYSLTAGTEYKAFAMQAPSLSGDAFRFGVTICYEDVIPDLFRHFVTDRDGKKRVEFMLNISNDGWFGRGPQQPQHLVSCAFRAVENRIGIARAVNTGVSGFLDSDGSWHDLMADPGDTPRAGGTGLRVAPVRIDRRVTFYSRCGDVFAKACAILTGLAIGDALMHGVRGWRALRRSRRPTVGR